MSHRVILDPKQEQIVYASEEISILVNAYAGTGKTRVLTERIIHLINERGVNPEKILAITFTNKSAEEMNKRIREGIKDPRKIPNDVCTIDAIFGQILREDIQDINIEWDSNFQIIDKKERNELLMRTWNQHHEKKVSSQNRTQMDEILKTYSEIRNKLWHKKKNLNKEDLTSFKEYDQYLKNWNLLDFDDILFYAKILLRDNENIRNKWIEKHQYIFVDEIQDLDMSRWESISLLFREGHTRFLGIGDPNQAIYLFRGDVMENIFTEVPKKITINMFTNLTTNYRSSPKIINFSSKYRRN